MATRKTVKKAAETTTQTQEVKTAEKAAAEAVKAEKAAAKETEKSAVKETAKAAEEKPAKAEKKTTARTRKTTAAKKEIKAEIVLQYGEKEVSTKDMIAAVKKEWTKAKHKISDIKSMELYVKPEDYAVYYVINGDTTGKVWL